MAQQTAVEWLYNHLFPKQLDGFSEEEWDKIDKAFEQAKQMEKEQMEKSYKQPLFSDCQTFDQYYTKTYGK